MRLQIRVSGVETLRRKMANAAECAISGATTRRGLSEVGRLITRAQKNMAPVRKGRVRLRELDRRLKRGVEVGKATRQSSVVIPKTRGAMLKAGVSGPQKFIKPGLVKRSIGYRVLRKQGNFLVKMGMNVGKKRSDNNFAPHAAILGASKRQPRYSNKFNSSVGPHRMFRGIMPRNTFIANATRFAAPAAIKALDAAVKADTVRAFNLSLRASRSMETVGS